MIRDAIDEVIDPGKKHRFTLDDAEKTEKTALGTVIEINFRKSLGLAKGRRLDLIINGVEVDVKNTMRRAWSIPTEAIGHPCILIRENERKARCDVGVIVAHSHILNRGANKDQKTTIIAGKLSNAWWILRDHPYPPNFWLTLSDDRRNVILSAGGGTKRVAALFREVQRQPIARNLVRDLGQQDDPMRRIRFGGGARDILSPEGIAILWGVGDRALIEKLGLPPIGPHQFISVKPTDAEQASLLKSADRLR